MQCVSVGAYRGQEETQSHSSQSEPAMAMAGSAAMGPITPVRLMPPSEIKAPSSWNAGPGTAESRQGRE